MALKLTSNVGSPHLEDVGSVSLEGDKIHILLSPFCESSITRDGNTIKLLETKEKLNSTSGIAKIGDVYTLTKGLEKLVVTISEDIPKESEPNIFLNEKDIFIKENSLIDATPKGRKTTLTVGILLLILLIVSVVFGIKQKNLREFNSKSEEKLATAITNYESQTRESFILAKEIATKLKEDGYKSEKLDELLSAVNEKESEILGEIKAETKEFLDLTLQTSGFSGDKLVSSGEEMFAWDKQNKNVLQVNIKDKKAKKKASGDELKDTKQIASYEDKLFLDKLDGVYEVNENSLFYVYAGNIYILNKESNSIQRYSGSSGGFGSPSDWLAPGIEADFSKVTDMTIDGSIWLLSSSGKVSKFTNGNPQSVSLEGMIEQFVNPTAIYTNETLKNVYVLDKEKGRVVVIDKTGVFKMQYISDEIKNAKDLVVSEEEGKIILLTGSKLIYFEPKQ